MLAVSTRGQPAWIAALATTAMNAIGPVDATGCIGMAARDPLKLRFEDNLVTSDRRRLERTRRHLIAKNPNCAWPDRPGAGSRRRTSRWRA